MRKFLNRVNAMLDAITNRSLENIVSQFERTRQRLEAFQQRKQEASARWNNEARIALAHRDECDIEGTRAERIAGRITGLLD